MPVKLDQMLTINTSNVDGRFGSIAAIRLNYHLSIQQIAVTHCDNF